MPNKLASILMNVSFSIILFVLNFDSFVIAISECEKY